MTEITCSKHSLKLKGRVKVRCVFSQPEFGAHRYGKRAKKSTGEKPAELWTPVCKKTHHLSRQRRSVSAWRTETKKDARFVRGIAKKTPVVGNDFASQSRQLTYDWRIKKRAWCLRWVICKLLFNHC